MPKQPRVLRATRALSELLPSGPRVGNVVYENVTRHSEWNPPAPHASHGGFNPLPIADVDQRTTQQVLADMIAKT
jgi:hypothetical protein